MADIKKVLTRLLAEMDAEDKDELLEELKGKKLTGAELVEAIKSLDPDARKEVRAILSDIEEEEDEEDEDEDGKEKGKKKQKVRASEDDTDEEEDDGKPKRRTRPGRKSGRAYGWWIDEDGEIVKLDIARVYSGEDEPDEVEMLPKDEDDEDEDDTENVA